MKHEYWCNCPYCNEANIIYNLNDKDCYCYSCQKSYLINSYAAIEVKDDCYTIIKKGNSPFIIEEIKK